MAWDSRARATPVDQELLTMPPWEVPLGTRRKQHPIARRNVKARELLEKRLEQKRPQNTVDIHTDATIRDERASMAWVGNRDSRRNVGEFNEASSGFESKGDERP
ncbi:hypothetical protein HPB50_014378 [Hyalomma asiaticum]|uniref:Uncharacterized protein n=1 Tax=Hyalomma asiaticum TaxID=266040 RepID=A0ACB7SHY5_HYAAI|nr:hypothetical protein HPB50_014378 [Hyalomma asiaticum]